MTQMPSVPSAAAPGTPAAPPAKDSARLLPGAGETAWPVDPITAYWLDAGQRWILLLDVLRQRGNNALEYSARTAPNVLTFEYELILDGARARTAGELRPGAHRPAGGNRRR